MRSSCRSQRRSREQCWHSAPGWCAFVPWRNLRGRNEETSGMAGTRGTTGSGSGSRMQYRCSFCGKGQDEVKRLIAGPGAVYICDECVELCREIIEEEEVPAPKVQPS